MKAVVAAFNQEKAPTRAFSVITNLRMELFEAIAHNPIITYTNSMDLYLLIPLYGGLGPAQCLHTEQCAAVSSAHHQNYVNTALVM